MLSIWISPKFCYLAKRVKMVYNTKATQSTKFMFITAVGRGECPEVP